MLGQLLASGLVQSCIYSVVALGMTVLFRSTGIVNFGYGAFFMAGAFSVYEVSQLGLGFVASLLGSVAIMVALGLLIERVLIRPISHGSHVTTAMMTVAISYLLTGTARFFWGQEILPMPPVFDGPPFIFGDVVVAAQDAVIEAGCLVLVVAFFLFFRWTNLGKLMQAASQAPRGAALVGINVPGFRNAMWGASAAVAAIAGALVAPVTLLYPDMGAQLLIKAFAAMALGGFGNLGGAVLGGLLIGLSEQLAGAYMSTTMTDIFAYLVILVVLIALPQGLLGKRETVRV